MMMMIIKLENELHYKCMEEEEAEKTNRTRQDWLLKGSETTRQDKTMFKVNLCLVEDVGLQEQEGQT